MTLAEIRKKLADAGIENASFEAELLVCSILRISSAKLLADPRGTDYSHPDLDAAVEKRAGRYPLQYILGSWEFCGLEFKVNENCLIPRPDTEVIVEEAVKCLKPGGRLLDLCTGSGCIAASVLHYTKNTTAAAVELYPETAALARENIASLGLADRCTVLTGDATLDLFAPEEKFDVITSNPPYVTMEEMTSLEPELAYEPSHALTDGGDGLRILSAIVRIYKNHLADGGVMILEHGWRQADAAADIARENGMRYRCLYDYGGNTRGAVLTQG